MTPFSTLEVCVLPSVLLIFGLRPTSRARTPPLRNSNPAPVYLRAAAGASPIVACPPALHAGAIYTNGQALEKPCNSATFCKLVQRPRPWQAGQARSASRSVVTISDLDLASDPGRRASLHTCPGKRRAISVGVHYSPRLHVPGREVKRKRASPASQTEKEWCHRRRQAPSARHV